MAKSFGRRERLPVFDFAILVRQAPCVLENLLYHDRVDVFDGRKHGDQFYPNHNFSTMKKFFALCSMIIALGFVAGCGCGKKESAPATGGDAATQSAEAPSDDTAPPDTPE